MDLLKWLGGLNEGEATLGTFGSLIGALATIAWGAWRGAKKARDKAMSAVPPTPVAQPAQQSPELAELHARLRGVERDQDVARLRWQADELLRQLRHTASEREALQGALTAERRINDEQRAEIARLERELANAYVQPDEEAQTWMTTPRNVFGDPPIRAQPPKLPKANT